MSGAALVVSLVLFGAAGAVLFLASVLGFGAALPGYLPLGHGFQKSTLHFGGGAVYFIGQNNMVEQRPGLKLKLAGFRPVDVGAG